MFHVCCIMYYYRWSSFALTSLQKKNCESTTKGLASGVPLILVHNIGHEMYCKFRTCSVSSLFSFFISVFWSIFRSPLLFHQVGEMIAGGFGTTAFRPQQAQRTHAQETKNRSFPNVSQWWGVPDKHVTDTNQSESHSGHQQLRFTRNYMGAWRTRRRPPTSSLLLD